MTADEFTKWLQQAGDGEIVVYHTGLLMKDAQCTHAQGLVRTAVQRAHDMGQVCLTQKPCDGGYEYRAHRTINRKSRIHHVGYFTHMSQKELGASGARTPRRA